MNIRDLFVPFGDELQLLPSKRVADPPLIEWKTAFGDLFFRIKGAEPEMMWCDLAYSVSPKRPLTAFKREQITRRLSKCWEKRLLYRVVPFEGGDDWALIRMGRFLVRSPSQKLPARWRGETSRLSPKKALAFASRPLSDYKEWTERDDDELRLSRAFAAMNEEERRLSVLSFANGDLESWAVAMRAVLSLVPPVPSRGDETVWHVALASWEPDARSKIQLSFTNFGLDGVAPLLATVDAHFDPHVEMARWRGVDANGRNTGVRLPALRVRAAQSAHEKMESLLFVRDFAREIGRENQVEPLLRELSS